MKMTLHREVLLRQPPRVLFGPFAFDSCGGLHMDAPAVDLLKRLQGLVNQHIVHDMVMYCTHLLVSFTIAGAVGQQLATSRLPYCGVDVGS